MSPCELTPTPVVTVKNNEVFANSRDVAAYFGKQHGHVLRDCFELIKEGGLSKSGDTPWFIERENVHPQNGQSYPSYDMTKDGFTLLVMSYTGKKALQFKRRYIEEFNRMEAQLKAQAPALPDFSNPAEAARV